MIRMWYSSSVSNSYIYCWLLYRSAPIMHTCWIPNINNGLELWGRRVTFLNHLPAFLPTFSLKIFSCLLYIFFFISVFRNITGSHAGHVMCVFLLWREFDKVKVSGNEHIFFFFSFVSKWDLRAPVEQVVNEVLFLSTYLPSRVVRHYA